MADKIGVVLGRQAWKVDVDERMGPENPCLWMQSGAVKFKDCKNEFDCITCKYDKAMGAKSAKGKQMTWQDSMRRRGGMDRICRHTLTNRIDGRICAINYECYKCDFDQMFEEVYDMSGGYRVKRGPHTGGPEPFGIGSRDKKCKAPHKGV